MKVLNKIDANLLNSKYFKHWLEGIAINEGIGIHEEYYALNEDYQNDCKVIVEITAV